MSDKPTQSETIENNPWHDVDDAELVYQNLTLDGNKLEEIDPDLIDENGNVVLPPENGLMSPKSLGLGSDEATGEQLDADA